VEAIVAIEERIRSPVVEGVFYPEVKAEVLAGLRSFGLERGKGGNAQALIVPHGAWEISGALAGAAFASAGGRTGPQSPSRVVIMGPIHDRRGDGLYLSNSHFFETPLGNIPVDQEISEALEAYSPLFEVNDIPHLQEHSIEVLLPFVKYAFPKASMVPILMARQREPVIAALAGALRTVLGPLMEDTLLVASCNLAMDPNEAAALAMSRECMRLVTEKKAAEFNAAILNSRLNSCGGGIVASLLLSGLVDHLRPIPRSVHSARDKRNRTVCYGALSFESM
jgi:AmmeMemoRadiSam system protein B